MKEFPKKYEPKKYEDSLYEKWESSGIFDPDNAKEEIKRYSNILPPPNANGELHIGHASGYVVMDLLGRFNRMLGKKTLLLPGKDHAGIQTQVVYEKKLKKEKGLSRHDIGRESFYERVYDFCMDRSNYMRNQEKKIGLSANWKREKFTLDPEILNIVLETFVLMHNEIDDEGNRMAYKGEKIINWCPRCSSALADIEVEHEQQKAKLYTFKYSKDFPFEIATTRPETKLGDTAVAVNPKDKRYKKYIGKTFKVDFLGIPLELKIISDPGIETEFGTGALGVTPAHSLADWEMAQKNDLKIIKTIDEEGKIKDGFGEFSQKQAIEAREIIVEKLRKKDLLSQEEEIDNNLSVCERCKSAIEPLPSKQWFIAVDHANFSLKKEARKVIENEEIKIYPARFKKIMLSWIDNVHDWCISRQIWWGPRIPAWYKNGKMKVQIASPGEEWNQDKDTFDTWFSSGQWSYTTLNYPDGKDFKDFYPSDTMIMGRDILPFWAFRMIILSLYRTRKIPFKNLYFTGLIRDENGQKMSKSKGNGIEPLEMIEKYGTDAVRMSLLVGSSPGNDMNLGEAKIEGYRNFANKLWNISRYILQSTEKSSQKINKEKLTVSDKAILQQMRLLIREITSSLEEYNFSKAGERLRDFTWNYLADWYLEITKFEKTTEKNKILRMILADLLKLWHPFIPFVSEQIWSEFNDSLLAAEKWPKEDRYTKVLGNINEKELYIFDKTITIIKAIRNERSEKRIEPSQKIKVIIYSEKLAEKLKEQEEIIKNLRTGIKELEIKKRGKKMSQAAYCSLGDVEIYIPLKGVLDTKKEKIRLENELQDLDYRAEFLRKKLTNEKFTENAPQEIVEKEKNKLKNQEEKIKKIKNFITSLE